MRVNLYKDQISPVGTMPPLPNDKALYASLRPAYNVLKAAGQLRASGRPMYAITDDQKKAADSFLKVALPSEPLLASALTYHFVGAVHAHVLTRVFPHIHSLLAI